MSIFISRPELWEKLLERKQQNIESFDVAEVPFHINMGINQAIGIMNSMPAYELPPCPNCGELSEMAFILKFAREEDFCFTVTKKQLRSLWTAYCIRHDYEVDTKPYDDDLRWIWSAVCENSTCPWGENEEDGIVGFEEFDNYMCEEVL